MRCEKNSTEQRKKIHEKLKVNQVLIREKIKDTKEEREEITKETLMRCKKKSIEQRRRIREK